MDQQKGNPLDGEEGDQEGGDQEEAKDPKLLEEVEVSCTWDLLVLETYSLRGRHTMREKEYTKSFQDMSILYKQLFPKL